MLADQGEGRIISLHFRVKLTPEVEVPLGETDGARDIVGQLEKAGMEALAKVMCGHGYDASITTAYFIF